MSDREPSIEALLSIDRDNPGKAIQWLDHLLGDSQALINKVSGACHGIGNSVAETYRYDKYQDLLNRWARSMDLKGDEALRLLQGATLIGEKTGDLMQEAQETLPIAIAFLIRIQLALRLQRDCLLAFAELLRRRAATAMGLTRLQIEAAVHIRLMCDQPGLAQSWMNTYGARAGKDYHNRTKTDAADYRKAWGFDEIFSEASGMAQHVRFMGSAPGWLLAKRDKASAGETGLSFIDVEDGDLLLLWFSRLFGFHCDLVERAPDMFPDFDRSVFSPIDTLGLREEHNRMLAVLKPRLPALRERGYGII